MGARTFLFLDNFFGKAGERKANGKNKRGFIKVSSWIKIT
jgi:hypothetical protein